MIGPIIGNLFLVILFFHALINPSAHKEFITNTSFIYFLTELFSLAACLLLVRFKLHPEDLGLQRTTNTSYDRLVNKLQYFSIACFFIIATSLIGYLINSWFVPLIFSLSLLSKAYSKNLVAKEKNLTVIAIIFLISYVFVYFSPVLWGIIYYGILAFFEIYNYIMYYKKS